MIRGVATLGPALWARSRFIGTDSGHDHPRIPAHPAALESDGQHCPSRRLVRRLRLGARHPIPLWHTRWFRLSPAIFDAVHYAGMALFEIGIFLLTLAPLLGLYLMGA
jgi:hypothetical protein